MGLQPGNRGGLNGAISQNIFFIVSAVKTSYPTYINIHDVGRSRYVEVKWHPAA
jgi:hypothetical protein